MSSLTRIAPRVQHSGEGSGDSGGSAPTVPAGAAPPHHYSDRVATQPPPDRAERVIPDPDRPGAWIVRIGVTDQSHIDPDRPTMLEFDYMQRIAEAIDLWAPPGQRLRIVHVGGAGMSLARYVAATRPTSAQIVLEPDTALTDEVRAKAPLPRRSGIKVRPVDGRTGIAAMPEDYADIVILDAFAGARVPADLVTLEFLTDVRRVLAPGGLFVANVTDGPPLDWVRRTGAGIARRWPHVAVSAEPSTWRGRRFGNIELYASDVPIPTADLGRAAARAVFAYRFLDDERMRDWCSGREPFTVVDTAPSPLPPQFFS